ncbi:hypothetical protein ACLKA7_014971 [Drosophila subpalustris]
MELTVPTVVWQPDLQLEVQIMQNNVTKWHCRWQLYSDRPLSCEFVLVWQSAKSLANLLPERFSEELASVKPINIRGALVWEPKQLTTLKYSHFETFDLAPQVEGAPTCRIDAPTLMSCGCNFRAPSPHFSCLLQFQLQLQFQLPPSLVSSSCL